MTELKCLVDWLNVTGLLCSSRLRSSWRNAPEGNSYWKSGSNTFLDMRLGRAPAESDIATRKSVEKKKRKWSRAYASSLRILQKRRLQTTWSIIRDIRYLFYWSYRFHLNFTNIKAAIGEKSPHKRFWKNSSQCWDYTAASKIGNSVISPLWELWCHCNPNHNKFPSLSDTTVVEIFPNLCLWRLSLCSYTTTWKITTIWLAKSSGISA